MGSSIKNGAGIDLNGWKANIKASFAHGSSEGYNENTVRLLTSR